MVYRQKPGPSASTFSFRDITQNCQSGKKVQKPTSQKEDSIGMETNFALFLYLHVTSAKWVFIKYQNQLSTNCCVTFRNYS